MAKQTLQLGEHFALPIGFANKTITVFGKGGVGKSNLEVVLAEELYHAGIPTCIVDPADIHYGIKSSRDGKTAGLPYIVFGGLHADVPIYPENGALLADLFLDRGLFMVLVTQQWTGGERARFMTDFANRLYRRGPEKEKRGSARVIILEEAHEYVPQQPNRGEEQMLGAMKRLYTVARNYWIGFIAATRRPAKMHTDLRNGADIGIFFQIVGTQDRKAMIDYLGEMAEPEDRAEILKNLASLPKGHAYVYQPHETTAVQKVHFRHRTTLDTSSTEVTAGHKAIQPVLAEVDLTRLGKELDAAREKAKEDDPRMLRARIVELERERAVRLKLAVPEPVKVKRVEVPVVKEPQLQRIERVIDRFWKTQELVNRLDPLLKGLQLDLRRVSEAKVASFPTSNEVPKRAMLDRTPRKPAYVTPVLRSGSGEGKVTGPQQKILDALAWFDAVGISEPSKVQVAMVAGYHPRTPGFANSLSSLRTAGLVDGLRLTAAGAAEARAPEAPPTSEALHQMVYQQIGPARSRILSAIIARGRDEVTREDLAQEVGYHPRTPGFANSLSSLTTLGVIVRVRPGVYRAADTLFL